MMICDCCGKNKPDALPRALGPLVTLGSHTYDRSNRVSAQPYVICDACIREIETLGSGAQAWLDDKLKHGGV